MYLLSNFTWGFELELGDVPKALKIPHGLGNWEFAERDIVNALPPYRGIAADPLGIDPPMGGEINLPPTKTPEEQLLKIGALLDFFREAGYRPSAPPTSHAHIHIHVPGLTEDLAALRNLMLYLKNNQRAFVKAVYRHEEVKGLVAKASTYLKVDGGRLMPEWLCDNISTARNFAEFIDLHCRGKDKLVRIRPIRYAINTYSLKHVRTIEFRCFRGSLDTRLLRNCFVAAGTFLALALNQGRPIAEWLEESNLEFPPMGTDVELLNGWAQTRKPESSAHRKNRVFINVA